MDPRDLQITNAIHRHRPVCRAGLAVALLLALTGGACMDDDPPDSPATQSPAPDPTPFPDEDGDGYHTDTDCDDGDAAVHPGASERCDGVDNDCDGQIDEAEALDALIWYRDEDGDGAGLESDTISACALPDGYAAGAGDCDDADPDVHPGADERCNGKDDNCIDGVDEASALDVSTWFADGDQDGYGDPKQGIEACDPPPGCVADVDCDDGNASSYPGAPEQCDDLDNDCDGEVDDGLLEAWYQDIDGDGWGNSATELVTCAPGEGRVLVGGDCDEADPSVYPTAPELCDHRDNDCDGSIDEDLPTDIWYADLDGDQYGDALEPFTDCAQPPETSPLDTDCDDTDAAVNPAGLETCDGVDEDCNDATDDVMTWYADEDGDGYGGALLYGCVAPEDAIVVGGDCRDGDAAFHPGAEEICDGQDNDCDRQVDELAVDAYTWYRDADGDGYGDPDLSLEACALPWGYVDNDQDCDDADSSVKPDIVWYADRDGDGFGNSSDTVIQCTQPEGYLEGTGDCDDSDPAVHRRAQEICDDGRDQDCDGEVDELCHGEVVLIWNVMNDLLLDGGE